MDLLRQQHGVFSINQLATLELSRSFVSGHPELFHEVLPRTFSVIPAPLRPEAATWAAVLWGSPALVSHLSALWLHGLVPAPAQPHILIRHRRRLKVPAAIRLHRSSVIAAGDACRVDALGVTSAVRTLIDAATLLPARRLVAVTASAAQRDLCSLPALQQYAVARPNLPGAARMMRALAQLDGGLESLREWDLLTALRRAGLPEPVPQYVVRDASGHVLTRPDFAYPQWKIAIYYDGRVAHLDVASFDADARKTAVLVAAGWRVLRVTNALLRDTRLLGAAVRQLVAAAA
ncbi:MAG: DUF559 domain-containing protein [Mycobacteriales bacterium]